MILNSATGVTIEELTVNDEATWDQSVRAFDNHRVVHTSAWNASLRSSGFGEPICLVMKRDGETVAAFPGLISKIGHLRIFGSPRAGWQTVSMGPAFDPARITTRDVIATAMSYLEQKHSVTHMELMHQQLDSDDMAALGFQEELVPTYRAPMVPNDEEATFGALNPVTRRNVRRAERLGLHVRFEDSDEFAREHFDQVREVYLRRGTAPPFGERRIRECISHMRSSGNLISVSVLLPDSDVSVASGIFLVEGDELALWTWAHRSHYRWYRATELMTWTAMRQAIDEGCNHFEMMGRGEFKTKFGATLDTTKKRFLRSRMSWLPMARNVVRVGTNFWSNVRAQVVNRTPAGRARFASSADQPAPACVIGDADLARSLVLAGHRPALLAAPGTAARYSRYVTERIPFHSARSNGDELLRELISWSVTQPEPPVLYYDTDDLLLLISRNRELLSRHFRFLLPSEDVVEKLVDKLRFQKFAEEKGLDVPQAITVRPETATAEPPGNIVFPAILKPLTHSHPEWHKVAGTAKAIRLHDSRELLNYWKLFTEAKLPFVVQQLIEGDETRIESYHVYCDANAKVVAEFTGRKIRTNPSEYGDSTALETTDAPDVIAAGRAALRKIRIPGVAKFDFKRDSSGNLWLLEVNPRFTLWHHLGAVAGLNIPALVHADLSNRERPPIEKARAGVRWCKVWSDLPVAQNAGISKRDWLKWVMQCESKSAFALDDPFPIIGAALHRLRNRGASTEEKPASLLHTLNSRERISAYPCTSPSSVPKDV